MAYALGVGPGFNGNRDLEIRISCQKLCRVQQVCEVLLLLCESFALGGACSQWSFWRCTCCANMW